MSVRLTEHIKTNIANAVMADVPKIDYMQQIEDKVLAWAVAKLPAPVFALYKDEQMRPWISHAELYLKGVGTVRVPYGGLSTTSEEDNAAYEHANDLIVKHIEQDEKFDDMRRVVMSAINSVSTVERLIAIAPDLSKYAERFLTGKAYPVAPVDMLKELRDAGWPKEG